MNTIALGAMQAAWRAHKEVCPPCRNAARRQSGPGRMCDQGRPLWDAARFEREETKSPDPVDRGSAAG